jgi:hypothetical protein
MEFDPIERSRAFAPKRAALNRASSIRFAGRQAAGFKLRERRAYGPRVDSPACHDLLPSDEGAKASWDGARSGSLEAGDGPQRPRPAESGATERKPRPRQIAKRARRLQKPCRSSLVFLHR